MSMKNRIIAAVGGAGLTVAIAVAAVTAGGPSGGLAAPQASPSATPAASTTPATSANTIVSTVAFGDFGGFGLITSGMPANAGAFAAVGMGDPAQCKDTESKLAANLGVTTDQLEAAIKKTMLQKIDDAEQSGKLTADQAKTARDRVNNATDLCTDFGPHRAGPDKQGPATGQGAGRGFGMVNGAAYKAVADFFGITTDQLQQDLRDLGSLQAVAAKYNKDNPTDKPKLKAAIEQALKDDLAQRGVSQDMIDRIVAQFDDNFETVYTMPIGQGMPFGPGGPGKRHSPRTTPSPSPSSQTQ